MRILPRNVLYYGNPSVLPEPHRLRAGPLSLTYEEGGLRGIRLGRREVVQRIYMAVRDRDWGTVSNTISGECIEKGSDSFRITYHVENRREDIHFVWDAVIAGSADGLITFSFQGEALTTFLQCRIGFCILHPMLECARQPCRVQRADRPDETGVFPVYIVATQPMEPFAEMTGLSYQVAPGVEVELGFVGDLFEMEDQRNWTDASYKTFCTPLRLGYPHPIAAGTKVAQSVTLRLTGDWENGSFAAHPTDAELTVALDTAAATPLPCIGVGAASHGEPLSPNEISRLRALNLSHLRLDLTPSQSGWQAEMHRVIGEARVLGTPLEIALHLSNDAEAELNQLATLVALVKPDVCRWLIFHTAEVVPAEKWVRIARQTLARCAPAVPVGSGTDADFFELNSRRPVPDALDFVTYSLNPQMHAFDNASLVETLPVQAVTAESARQFVGRRPIIISPITLKMRFNPYATAPEVTRPGTLPSQVDPRQMSLFGAGWTLGSIKHTAESGQVSSITYYETTGWRGVMDTENGASLPEQFPALPGMVFPLYHVLAAVGEFAGGESLRVESSNPAIVEAMALRKDGRLRVLLANFTDEPRRVILNGLPDGVRCKCLDENTIATALRAPEIFCAQPSEALSKHELSLLPFAVAILDVV